MTSSARLPQAEITGVFGMLAKRFSKQKLGRVPESLGVMWHNQQVMRTMFGVAGKAQKWNACDQQLKSFAHMATVAKVGCSFCLDFGYFEAHNHKLDLVKAREVPNWRASNVFSPLERDVLAYAEAMTDSPPTVTDDLFARLRTQLGNEAMLELTAYIGFANLVSRTNVALGVESEGFAASCGLKPLAMPATPSAALSTPKPALLT